jgi:hypothetical protein
MKNYRTRKDQHPSTRRRSLGSSFYQPQFSYRQVLFSWLGSFLGITILA